MTTSIDEAPPEGSGFMEIHHSCGHIIRKELPEALRRGDRGPYPRVAKTPTLACPDCRLSSKQETAEERGLPPLEGTPKQASWAESIRGNMLPAIEAVAEQHKEGASKEAASALDDLLLFLRNEKRAVWWINNRTGTITIRELRGLYRVIKQEKK